MWVKDVGKAVTLFEVFRRRFESDLRGWRRSTDGVSKGGAKALRTAKNA